MKRIEAIVRPERLRGVLTALSAVAHAGVTVTRVKGHGTQGGVRQMWRCKEYVADLLPKVRLTLVVPDELLDATVSAIVESARTGRMGDGKIFVSRVCDAIRVRTGESGVAALAPAEARLRPVPAVLRVSA